MKLGEYYLLRCGGKRLTGLSLTYIEKRNFKIPDSKKGWVVRTKDIEVNDSTILLTLKEVLDKFEVKPRVRKNMELMISNLENLEVSVEQKFKEGKEFLYLAENELGMVKVGISKTPQARIEQIQSASGLTVKMLGYYTGNEEAREVERSVLKHFKKYLKLGEWFMVNTVTQKMIEEILPKSYIKVV